MNHLSKLLAYQKDLNIRSTLSERQLVGRLRGAGIKPVKTQVIVGPFIVDILIPHKMLIVEVDGSHHLDKDVQAYDERRTAYLSSLGFEVFRVSNTQVKSVETLKAIAAYPDRGSRKSLNRLLGRLMEQRNFPSGVVSYGPEF
jgi:very-short-patch-repair endonuclease